MNVAFHEQALQELQDSHAWYARQSATAPVRLMQEIETAIQRIFANPESSPIAYKLFRSIRLRRFPYVVVYETLGKDSIKILAIAHTSRRPGYWKQRR